MDYGDDMLLNQISVVKWTQHLHYWKTEIRFIHPYNVHLLLSNNSKDQSPVIQFFFHDKLPMNEFGMNM